MAEPITKGDRFELRIARLLFWEGAFVRRAIDLNMHFGEEFTVTDIDILALRFTRDMELHIAIGEAKTTETKNAPKATDRLLWGGGLRTLVGADANFVATIKAASERVRRLATQLGAHLLDERDIAHREGILGIEEHTPWGPHDPELLATQRTVYDALKRDGDLKRVYWFVRSDFWFSQPVPGLKRALGACRLLGTRFNDRLPEAERAAVRWLAHQAIATVVVALVRIAAASYRQPPDVARARLTEQLSEGLADYPTLVELSRTVDRYVMAVLRDASVDPGRVVGALGALSPEPPSYTEPLLEVVERLAAEPAASAQLPRTVDWHIAEAALGRKLGRLPAATVEVVDGDVDRLLRTIGAFLTGQTKLPGALIEGVLAPPTEASPTPVAHVNQNTAVDSSSQPHPERGQTSTGRSSDGGAGPPTADAGSTGPEPLFGGNAPQPGRGNGEPEIVAGDPKRFRLGQLTHAGTAAQPIPARAVTIHVRNLGSEPARIRQANARSDRHGDLAFDGQSEVPPGGDGQLDFQMTAPTADEGLLPGERLDVAVDYGNGQTRFAARWLGPEPHAWELVPPS